MRERLLSALNLFDSDLEGVPKGWILDVILNDVAQDSAGGKRDLRPDDVRFLTIRLLEFSKYEGEPVRPNVDLDLELIPVGHC